MVKSVQERLLREFFDGELVTSLSFLMGNISEHVLPHGLVVSSSHLYAHTTNLTLAIETLHNSNLIPWIQDVLAYVTLFFSLLISVWLLNRTVTKNRMVSSALELILCYIVILPALPIIAALYSGVFIHRTALWLFLRVFYGGKRFLASAEDSFWFYEKYASSSACAGVYIVEGTCRPEVIRQRLLEVATSELVGDKMRKKFIQFGGFPCWELVENFDINDHVKTVLQKPPGQPPVTERELFEYMKSIQDHLLVGKAPWEAVVIPSFQYQNPTAEQKTKTYYAVIFRLHHGIMDGVSTGNVLHSAIADKPFRFVIDPLKEIVKTNKLKTAFVYLLAFLMLPKSGLKNLLKLDNFENQYYQPGPMLTGPKHFTWTRPICMDTLKTMKNTTDTSIFAILISCLGGAMRKLHLKRGKSLQSDFVHALSPVAMLPYPDRKPRNGFSVMWLAVPVGKNTTGKERLDIMYNIAKKFNAIQIVGDYYLIAMFGLLPVILQQLVSRLVFVKMSLTNIPGPAEPVKLFGGDTLVDIGAWIPIKLSLGVGMGLFSYNGKMRATVIGDKAYFSDEAEVEMIREEFENEMCLLAKDIGVREDKLFVER